MSKAEGQAGVRDEVRKAVSSAEQARVGVVCKPLLCPLDGGLQGQGRCAALLILHAHLLVSDLRTSRQCPVRSQPTRKQVLQEIINSSVQDVMPCACGLIKSSGCSVTIIRLDKSILGH